MAGGNGKEKRAPRPPRTRIVKETLGRPRTTLSDLPKNWLEIMMEASKEGASTITHMKNLGIGHTAFETLLKDSVEFQIAVEMSRINAQHWHETVGRNMMTGAQGNAVSWKFAMQNQFGWRDKQQLSGDEQSPLSVSVSNQKLTKEDLLEQLKARGLPTSLAKED